MPARKPLTLHSETDRHTTRHEARRAAEESLIPVGMLPMEPPEELRGYPVAESCWIYHVGLYQSLQAQIVTTLDAHVLIEYCLSWQYLDDLKQVRRKALELRKFDLLLSVDARLDRKGARLDALRQQLYLTPRSRAGVAPAEKPPEESGWTLPEGGYRWEDLLKEQNDEKG